MYAGETLAREQFMPGAADKLFDHPEIASILEPYISRVALSRNDYIARYNDLKSEGRENEQDELEQGLLSVITDVDFLEVTSEEERGLMIPAFQNIARTLQENPQLYNEGRVDWNGLTQHMLEEVVGYKADGTENESSQSALLSAFMSSIFADDRNVRTNFIEAVYDKGLHLDVEDILWGTPYWRVITYLADGSRSINGLAGFHNAFTTSKEQLAHYIKYTESRTVAPAEKSRPKQRQKEIAAAYKNSGVSRDIIETAQRESQSPPDKENADLDVYKIERFALEQMFIEDQMAAVFPEGQLKDSPFRQLLFRKRKREYVSPFSDLRNDARGTIGELTQPVINDYTPESTSNELSKQQAAALRFREIIKLAADFRHIASYIDYERGEFIAPSSERDIWTIPQEGAAAPEITEVYLSHIVHQALRFSQKTGERPPPQELYELAQSNRRAMMRLAMVNIDDFSIFSFQPEFRRIPADKLNAAEESGTPVMMGRAEDGSLNLDLPILTQQVKGLSSSYRGATLGCPAGRVALQDIKNPQARGLHATNNFIDYIIEGMIDEAYERGLFDLSNYQHNAL